MCHIVNRTYTDKPGVHFNLSQSFLQYLMNTLVDSLTHFLTHINARHPTKLKLHTTLKPCTVDTGSIYISFLKNYFRVLYKEGEEGVINVQFLMRRRLKDTPFSYICETWLPPTYWLKVKVWKSLFHIILKVRDF